MPARSVADRSYRDRFLGLCLSREEPRQFYLERCQNVQLASAADFLMPVATAG